MEYSVLDRDNQVYIYNIKMLNPTRCKYLKRCKKDIFQYKSQIITS